MPMHYLNKKIPNFGMFLLKDSDYLIQCVDGVNGMPRCDIIIIIIIIN